MTAHRVLVTGGAGFIGSTLVEKLVQKNFRVIVLDALTYAGHRTNLAHIPSSKFEFVEGNICDGPLVDKILKENKVTAILNLAAESHVDRSIDKPGAFFETNVQGTFTLLNVSLNYWFKLSDADRSIFRYLQVSTDEVFGSLEASGKFNENSPITPNSPYSSTKAAGDLLVGAWNHTYNFPTITTHCSNNYGPRQYPEKLIPRMIDCALEGKPLPVYGDGKNVRDWIQVEDHCQGIILALEKGIPGKRYCFGGNSERTNIHVVSFLCEQLDKLHKRKDGKSYKDQISYAPDRRGHDRRYAIDDQVAQKELGFKHHHDFEKSLSQTIQWYLENQAWKKAVMEKNK
jgi:dTDP-glucose 4,6-dehydratase